MAAPPRPPPGPPPGPPPKPQRRGDSDSESEAESEGGGFGAALRNEQRELLARTLRLEAAVSAHAADDQLRAKRAVADAAWRHEWKRARAGYGSAVSQGGGGGARASLLGAKASLESARQPLLKREALALGARAAAVATSLRSKPAPPGCAALAERAAALGDRVGGVVAKLRAVENLSVCRVLAAINRVPISRRTVLDDRREPRQREALGPLVLESSNARRADSIAGRGTKYRLRFRDERPDVLAQLRVTSQETKAAPGRIPGPARLEEPVVTAVHAAIREQQRR